LERGHILLHDSIGANHGTTANAHAREHDAARAEPRIFLDDDGTLRDRGKAADARIVRMR
jgi:hypothetical protein